MSNISNETSGETTVGSHPTAFQMLLAAIFANKDYYKLYQININFRTIHAWLTVVAMPLLGVFGIIGNLVIGGIFVAKRKAWRKHHVYLLAMTVSDSLVMIWFMVYNAFYFALYILTDGKHYIGLFSENKVACKMLPLLVATAFGASNMNLMCLTCDRLHALYAPFHYRQMSKKTPVILVSGFFVLHCLISTVSAVYMTPMKMIQYQQEMTVCWIGPEDFIPGVITIFLYYVYYRGPLITTILFILNIILFAKIRQINASSAAMSTAVDKSTKKSAKAAKTTVALSALYVACFTPAALVGMYSTVITLVSKPGDIQFILHREFMLMMGNTLQIVAFAAVAVNWLIYAVSIDFCYEALAPFKIFQLIGFKPKAVKTSQSITSVSMEMNKIK